ncbi:uncharacterized protein LOC135097952 isoform X1 [Scylla paramamosain]|uniref:uncharacterized protein LOC135097952 isoform X1 n=1 Tax=Scylla paramamosain TaxID=85552 RepID=UPI00308279BE
MRTCLKPDPSGARLTLDPAQGSDTATYKCRVDFEMSSTRSTLVTLTVYVVPSCLVLLDTGWSPVHGGVLRSLIEGDPLTLQCTASGASAADSPVMVSPPSVLVLARPSSPRRPKRKGRCSTRPSSPPGSVRPGRGSSARSASPASSASGGTRTHSRSPSKPSRRTSGTAASLSASS